MPAASVEAFERALAQHGLNLCGVMSMAGARQLWIADVPAIDLPATGSLVLCGSGGPGHWQSLSEDERARPDAIASAARRQVTAALPRLPGRGRLLSETEMNGFDLRALTEGVGWGRVSPYLQLLIHPVYGPWVSVRAAVALDTALSPSLRLPDYDPCGPCARPCLTACPVGAYLPGHDFDIHRCAAHRLAERAPAQHCADACHARCACPVGRGHAYGPAELRHRHRSSLDDLPSQPTTPTSSANEQADRYVPRLNKS